MKTTDLTETEIDVLVLEYLRKCKIQYGKHYGNLTIYGVRPDSLIKYIAGHESIKRWKDELFDKLERAIEKIVTQKCSIPYPVITGQTEEDRVLAKIIEKLHWRLFNSSFWRIPIDHQHIVKYLNRDEELKDWNADFIINVQQEVDRIKRYLLTKDTEESLGVTEL